MMGFKPPPKFKVKPMGAAPTIPIVTPPPSNTLHALNEEVSRRRNNMYANPGDTQVKETGNPQYFTGIKRLLRSKYGGSGSI
jgi:hypothetical protein